MERGTEWILHLNLWDEKQKALSLSQSLYGFDKAKFAFYKKIKVVNER